MFGLSYLFFFFYQSQENISMINIHSHAHIQIEFQSDSNLKISLSCASLHNISSLFFMLYVFTNSASIIVSFFLYVLCSLQTSKSCHHPVTELVLVLQNTKQSPSEINYRYIMPDGIPRSFRSDWDNEFYFPEWKLYNDSIISFTDKYKIIDLVWFSNTGNFEVTTYVCKFKEMDRQI